MQLLEEYLDSILEQVHPLTPIELPIEEALDHVLACDLEARMAVPPFSNSGMDGFAIYLDDDYEASPEHPLILPVAGDIAAGDNTDHVLEPGSAWRIMTGARLPKGANTVVPVEDTSEEPGPHPLPKSISIYAPIKVGAHVRTQGEDCAPGDTVLRAGDILTPAAMASAVSVGYAKVSVYPSPRVAIVSTGDELRAPGENLKGAQIPDSNSVMIAAWHAAPVPRSWVFSGQMTIRRSSRMFFSALARLLTSSSLRAASAQAPTMWSRKSAWDRASNLFASQCSPENRKVSEFFRQRMAAKSCLQPSRVTPFLCSFHSTCLFGRFWPNSLVATDTNCCAPSLSLRRMAGARRPESVSWFQSFSPNPMAPNKPRLLFPRTSWGRARILLPLCTP